MKKILKSLVAMACCLCVLPFATACGEDKGNDLSINPDGTIKPSDKTAIVSFWINGDDSEIEVFDSLVKKFNSTTGKELNVKVELVQRTGDSYGDILGQSLAQGNAGDVFYVGDSGYKQYAENGYLYDITDFIEGNPDKNIPKSELYKPEEMWDNVVTRYKYDVNTYESGTATGRYYGVPKDLGPTVIFYNETYFEGAGIKILSVDEAGLVAFNAGGKDDRGNTKADLGLGSATVKEKGYFVVNGQKYFNNQIPMSWEETRECAKVVQDYMRSHGKPQGYGYFTEWWFNYGWSVGGNCIQKIPSDKYDCGYYYDFTLMDNTKNYIVKDDVPEGVTVNKKHYGPGKIIAYQDKLDMSIYAGKKAADGASMYQNAANYKITDEVKALYDAKKLNELPSQREAFAEFVRIGDVKKDGKLVDIDGTQAYGICPLPTDIDGDAGKTSEFMAGRLGMLVDGRWNVTKFREEKNGLLKGITWDVAPLPMYKEYDADGNVTVHGIEAGHSGSVGLCISAKSKLKVAAWKFVEFCGGEEGQKAQSLKGFAIPLQKKLAEDEEIFLQTNQMPRNSKVFLDATSYEQAGDWWFLQDNKWIDAWAGKLNGSVRNGTMTFEEFFKSSDYSKTFGLLEKYTKNK